MKRFEDRLNKVEGSYYGFVAAVLNYVKKKPSRFIVVEKYMDDNPYADTSDILGFISGQDDFYEDADFSYTSECSYVKV